jgi:hypothetical protein
MGHATAHILGHADLGPQLGWAVPDLCRAKNCVLWAGLLGTTQMYTYTHRTVWCARPGHTSIVPCSFLLNPFLGLFIGLL